MIPDVKRCVDLRTDYFATYFTVPPALQPEVDAFVSKLNELGEQCRDATEFEARFASTGLSDTFNALLPRCTPKPVKVTKQDRKQFARNTRDMLRENKEELLRDAARDGAEQLAHAAEGELLKQNREKMIQEGTFDDYTRTRNAVQDAGSIWDFFRRKKK